MMIKLICFLTCNKKQIFCSLALITEKDVHLEVLNTLKTSLDHNYPKIITKFQILKASLQSILQVIFCKIISTNKQKTLYFQKRISIS